MRTLAILTLLTVLWGCAAGPSAKAPVEIESRRVLAFHGQDGTPAAWSELVAAAASADAVIVGENHGHPLGLASASAAWSDILTTSPHAALAMEFFERDQQAALDDYVAGLTDEAAFRKAARRTDDNYAPGHRAMIEAARAAHRPIIGANAPRVYVRAASTAGYEKLAELTPEQRRLFRVPDSLPTGAYRDAFEKVMSEMGGPGHGAADKSEKPKVNDAAAQAAAEAKARARLEGAFRSQSLWDWTMAESVSRSLDAGQSPTLLVVGRFHIDHEGGLVQALRKLRPSTRVVTISYVDELSSSLRQDDKGRADFVLYVGPSDDADAK